MATTHDVETYRGQTLHGADGEKIGTIDEVYLDRATGEPEWLAVTTGLFGSNVSFVPLRQATRGDEGILVPYDKALVKDAPNVEPDGELSREEEQRLYQHYGVEFGNYDYDSEPTGHDTSGPNTDNAMTRSEEEVAVGTRDVERGRVRLRKYVVTEDVTTTVPVRKEKLRI